MVDGDFPMPAEWFCDACSEIVTVENGNVEFSKGKAFGKLGSDFKIVHRKKECSFKHQQERDAYLYLSDFIGSSGIYSSISRLERFSNGDYSSGEMQDYLKFLRRIYVPFWEVARGKIVKYARTYDLDQRELEAGGIALFKQIAEWENEE